MAYAGQLAGCGMALTSAREGLCWPAHVAGSHTSSPSSSHGCASLSGGLGVRAECNKSTGSRSSSFYSGQAVIVPANVWQKSSSAQSDFSLRVIARRGGGGGGGGGGMARRGPRLSVNPAVQQGDTPPMNEQIRVPVVRLLAADNAMIGTMSRLEALEKAREAGLDLVMISADADPPVVRIVDYSKFRFEQQKKKREQQKKAAANRTETKELKMRYNIDTHDYEVKLRAAQNFLMDGDRVKVSVQFRGREIEFRDLGVKLFERFTKDVGEIGLSDARPQMEGRTMQILISPNKLVTQKMKAAQPKDEGKKKGKRRDEDTLEKEDEDDDEDEDESQEDASDGANGHVVELVSSEGSREASPTTVGIE